LQDRDVDVADVVPSPNEGGYTVHHIVDQIGAGSRREVGEMVDVAIRLRHRRAVDGNRSGSAEEEVGPSVDDSTSKLLSELPEIAP